MRPLGQRSSKRRPGVLRWSWWTAILSCDVNTLPICLRAVGDMLSGRKCATFAGWIDHQRTTREDGGAPAPNASQGTETSQGIEQVAGPAGAGKHSLGPTSSSIGIHRLSCRRCQEGCAHSGPEHEEVPPSKRPPVHNTAERIEKAWCVRP